MFEEISLSEIMVV